MAEKRNSISSSGDSKGADVEAHVEPVGEIGGVDHGDHLRDTSDSTATVRGLKSRHLQLIGIGKSLTTLKWTMTDHARCCDRYRIVYRFGPFPNLRWPSWLAYAAYSLVIWGICLGTCEMATFLPVRGGLVAWSSMFLDEAAATALGWNYFYAATMFGCSDIIAFAGLFAFWLPDLSPAVWISIALVVITLLNSYHVKFFGESEFYLASLKVLLMVGIILMTFVVMLGGNPDHDRIGFRYWKDPGVMAEYYTTGPLAKFLGFFQVFKIAAYSIGGPDLVAMSSAEAVQPRKTIPRATKSIVVRMALFFVLGAICMGILVPYNDADLKEAVATGVGANASAFVVGMNRVHIKVLPHIFNAIVCTSALSCSNGFAYIATRLLHALASQGKAPKFFARTTKHGIPLFAYMAVLAIYCLAYLEVGTNSATVFGWFINLSSVGALINFAALAVLSLRFRAAIKKQGFDAKTLLPWYSRWTVPYTWFSLIFITIITLFQGWTVFVHGGWDLEDFFTSYFGLALVTVIFVAWKLYHKTKFVKLEDIDLTSRIAEFDSLDQYYEDHPIQSTTMWGRFLDKLF